MPQLRKDPILKQWVIISPERGKRPSDFKAAPVKLDDSADCPFCQGHESMTPPETLAFRTAGTAANSTGWWIRIIPDKAPILIPEGDSNREGIGMFDAMNSIGVHEMVIESPDHATTISNATPNQVKAKSGEGGRLFGSVSTKQIADALQKKHGFKVDKRKMECNDGIRSLGFTNVPVKLHHDVKATLKVHVIEE